MMAGLIDRLEGKGYELGEGVTKIGRGEDCEIIVPNFGGNISRQHSFILGYGRSYYIGDVSTNGVFISREGEMVSPGKLLDSEFFLNKLFSYEDDWSVLKSREIDEKGIKREYLFNLILADRKNFSEFVESGELEELQEEDVIYTGGIFLFKNG